MNDLVIPATQYTPKIELRATGSIEMVGKSYPENTFEFYQPVMAWVRSYLVSDQVNKQLRVSCEIVYFNSSSSKMFFDFFDLLDAHREKLEIHVEWRYDEENDIAKESGEDFVADFPNLAIELVEF